MCVMTIFVTNLYVEAIMINHCFICVFLLRVKDYVTNL